MFIKTYTVGPLAEHPYLIIDEKEKEAAVIDPGGGSEQIIDDLAKYDANLKYIINTHGHPDHIAENAILSDMTNAQILIHKNDAPALNFDFTNFSKKYNLAILAGKTNKILSGGEVLNIGKIKLDILQTPGHTPGSICVYIQNEHVIFTGDTLFYHTIGRTDLPLSDSQKMKTSLEKLFSLPDKTEVLPGHGKQTVIREEKEFAGNYYEQLLR
jgi:glyoxylase-like metal-dependent hydrolase (beta-lactamase superfamily II)